MPAASAHSSELPAASAPRFGFTPRIVEGKPAPANAEKATPEQIAELLGEPPTPEPAHGDGPAVTGEEGVALCNDLIRKSREKVAKGA